jgi:hypothetical protein
VASDEQPRDLALRLDEAIAGREGADLVEAVRRLGDELDEPGREELGRMLVDRAKEQGGFDYGLIRRIEEPYLQLFRPRPVEPGLDRPRPRLRRRRDSD